MTGTEYLYKFYIWWQRIIVDSFTMVYDSPKTIQEVESDAVLRFQDGWDDYNQDRDYTLANNDGKVIA